MTKENVHIFSHSNKTIRICHLCYSYSTFFYTYYYSKSSKPMFRVSRTISRLYSTVLESSALFHTWTNTVSSRFEEFALGACYILDASSSPPSSVPLHGRSAIAILEEDKRCFACTTFPHAGAAKRCIVPCHYNQRCYLKAKHANATRKLIKVKLLLACFVLFTRLVIF